MGVIPWWPLAGGWLTGKYRKGQDLPETRRAQMVPARYDMSTRPTSASSTPPTRSPSSPTRPASP